MPKQNHNDQFIKECIERLKSIKENGKLTVFTISSTSTKNKDELIPYATPIRRSKNFNITGCIVYTQAQALLIASKIDGMANIILVDSEKKIPMLIEPDISLLPENLKKITLGDEKTVSNVETGNLTAVCYEAIQESDFFEFKPNDITVDAVYGFVSTKLKFLSGKKIAIIGAGNIGSKIALKFLEAGCDVSLHRRNSYKGEAITQALNYIKPVATIAKATFSDDILKACFLSDVVIGATDYGIIRWEHIAACKKNVLLIDTGKGSFNPHTISQCVNQSISIYRTDITAFLDGYIYSLLKQKELTEYHIGRNTINGVSFVSGGLLGSYEDVIVDNCYNPKILIGLADGKGDLIRNLTEPQRLKLNEIKEQLK